MRTPATCRVCKEVGPIDLIELDTLMGDPSAWPASVWGTMFDPPKGALPASMRRWGAVEMGAEWLERRGLDIDRRHVRRHYRFDVPKIGVTPEELVATGLISKGNTHTEVATVDPLAYLTYYNEGIAVGIKGLQLIHARIKEIESKGEEVPMALVKLAIDAGKSLAMSQAAILARGSQWGGEDDADEGFRAGSAPEASPRMGNHRIRVVEGVARPVVDRGPADRVKYNERAEQEGSPKLPAP